MSRYWPARKCSSSTAGSRRNTAITSSARRSMRSMRQGRLFTSTSGAGRISRASTRQVGQRARLAQQRVALASASCLRDARRALAGYATRARQDARAAGRAMPALAAVRQVEACAQRRCQHVLERVGGEALAGREDRDLRHGSSMPRRRPIGIPPTGSRMLFTWIRSGPCTPGSPACLIAGCGYVGTRLARRLAGHRDVARSCARHAAQLRCADGIEALELDLDRA